jgi:hypothetical protein
MSKDHEVIKNEANKPFILNSNDKAINTYTTINVEFQKILIQIVTEQGDTILSEPKRVSSFLSDLAREVPKPQKTALIKSLENGFAKTLKGVPEPELNICKQKLAQKLNKEEGLELKLCEETLELLATVLFGEGKKKKDILTCVQ